MSTLVSKVKSRGIDHVVNAPTLEMRDVYVAYASGANGGVTVPDRSHGGRHNALEAVTFKVK
ncbi:MAG: hypothetical protein R3351_07590, partial [Nitrospirales bacterium]|nr:hypothetical protein [Nitrospirales bacterium]